MHNWENILGMSSIILLFLPVILLLVNYKEGGLSFLALSFYFLQVIIINLFSTGLVPVSKKLAMYAGIWNNLMDAPLILISLLYFANNEKTKKTLWWLAGAFIAFELIIYLAVGLSNKMLTIILGPDLWVATAFSLYFFIRHVGSSFNHQKDTGKAFITGGLLFAYACFNFIYLLFYVMENQHKEDIFKIYHLTYIIVSITISIGLLIIMREKRRKPIIEPKIKQDDLNAFQYL